jgi:TonB family protein
MKPVITTTPHGSFIFGKVFDFSHRDIVCLSFALGVHALLLLWKGGSILLPNKVEDGLGNTLVAVRFMNEIPTYETPGGSSPAAPQSFLARMRSIIRGDGGARPKKEAVAMGQSEKIEVTKPSWNKAETLADKAFNDKKGFQGVTEKKENLNVAMGKSNDILVKASQGNFKAAEPNLKESAFKVATKDAPFKILKAKNDDALSNVNAIPVAVGRTTSSQVKALDGGPGAGPALQSKAFANTGAKPFGGGSFGSSSGGKEAAGGGGGLSTGGAMAALPAGAGMGMGAGAGNGAGNGASMGSGRGTGVGSGSGTSYGNGSGKSWGGAGSGSSSLEALPRNRITDDIPSATSAASRNGAGFNITGALANRPIISKKQPTYERDARVALRFRVDWSGHVLDGIIIELSSGSPTFDNKVLEALKEWQFSRLPSNRTNEIQEGVITFVFKGV